MLSGTYLFTPSTLLRWCPLLVFRNLVDRSNTMLTHYATIVQDKELRVCGGVYAACQHNRSSSGADFVDWIRTWLIYYRYIGNQSNAPHHCMLQIKLMTIPFPIKIKGAPRICRYTVYQLHLNFKIFIILLNKTLANVLNCEFQKLVNVTNYFYIST